MNNIETYNIKERFPVGDKGVVLLEYPTMQKRFAICLYDQRNPDQLYGRVSETSEQAAYRIYLERCDTLVEQLEQRTGIQFPLPASCMAVLTSTGDLVNIRRGMTGYFPSDWNAPGDRKRNEETAAFQNAQHELTKAQCAAMVCGSMFGWDVPGANPEMYDEDGHFISGSVRSMRASCICRSFRRFSRIPWCPSSVTSTAISCCRSTLSRFPRMKRSRRSSASCSARRRKSLTGSESRTRTTTFPPSSRMTSNSSARNPKSSLTISRPAINA